MIRDLIAIARSDFHGERGDELLSDVMAMLLAVVAVVVGCGWVVGGWGQ